MSKVLDRAAILTATETALRRHGPDKTTVVDVARSLGVSHGSVYRHFPSKAALREAVTRRWLQGAHRELAGLAADTATPPPERLHAWLMALFTGSRDRAVDDPELHATYWALASEQSTVVEDHIADLVGQIRGILDAGIADGSIRVSDPGTAAHAVLDATVRFHHPAHAHSWRTRPGLVDDCAAVADLLVRGLTGTAR